jgi:hypothetical protein
VAVAAPPLGSFMKRLLGIRDRAAAAGARTA